MMPVEVAINADELGHAVDGALVPLLETAIRAAAAVRELADAEFSLTLLDDGAISELNGRFLHHEGPTDVIAFALYEKGELPVGDIYLGYEQALRQAAENGLPADQELARLAVHGALHVLGYDHPAGDERLETEMWRLQESIVSTLFAG